MAKRTETVQAGFSDPATPGHQRHIEPQTLKRGGHPHGHHVTRTERHGDGSVVHHHAHGGYTVHHAHGGVTHHDSQGRACGGRRKHGGHVEGAHAKHHLGKHARGGGTEKWIGHARAQMEKKGTVGALHRQLGVAQGEKIPEKKLSAAKAKAERTGNTKLIRRITFAQNVRR